MKLFGKMKIFEKNEHETSFCFLKLVHGFGQPWKLETFQPKPGCKKRLPSPELKIFC